MNFFEDQRLARKKTNRLLFIFYAIVITIGALTALLLTLAFNYKEFREAELFTSLQNVFYSPMFWQAMGLVTLAVSGVLLIQSYIELRRLKADPSEICKSMGAKLVSSNSKDPKVKQYCNIVEEMSIASGVPVPKIYLLQDDAINAFACGFDINSAAVCITTGCMNRLTRDELQGVIAHEFSHILNGDMTINLRLIAMLAGLILIFEAGRVIMHSQSRRRSSRESGGLAGIGLALMGLGGVGYLGGVFLKSAISRQREYLADASSVQFTRNPDGIMGALKKIMVNSRQGILESKHAGKASHMFLVSGLKSRFSLSTHPPLEKRIQAIDPKFDVKKFEKQEAKQLLSEMAKIEKQAHEAPFEPAKKKGNHWQEQLEKLTPLLLMYGGKKQMDLFVLNLLRRDEESFKKLSYDDIEVLLEQASGVLQTLTTEEKQHVHQEMLNEINKDGKISFYEFLIYAYLSPALKEVKIAPKRLGKNKSEQALNILSSFFFYLDDNDQGSLSSLPFELELIPRQKLSYSLVLKTLEELRFSQIKVKERAVSNLKAMAKLNGEVSEKERVIFRLLCQLFSVPGSIIDE